MDNKTYCYSIVNTLFPDTVQWGITGGNILDMDVVGPEEYVYWVSVSDKLSGDWKIQHLYAVYTDDQSNKLRSYDIVDFFREKGYLPDNTSILSTLDSDASGNIYVSVLEQNMVYMLFPEGTLIKQYTFPTTTEYGSLNSFLTENGERIFVYQSENGSQFVWLGTETVDTKVFIFRKRN